jgi:preprotein translocase subunit YajC
MIVLAQGSSSSKTPTTSNPLVSLLPLILIFGLAYVLFLRPRAQQARRQRDTLMELSAGDEVLTGAGIFGTVLDVESDRVTIETAPGTRITVLRSTIARRLTDPAVETPNWDEHDEDEAHGAYHEYEHDHSDDEHEHDEHDEHEDADEDDGHEGDDAATDEHEEHDGHEDAAEGSAGHDGATDTDSSEDKKT